MVCPPERVSHACLVPCMLGTPGCPTSSGPAQEPRPVSWNCSFEARANHHGNVATNKMITPKCADYVTTSFKNRWRSLMSVDDIIESLVEFVENKGIADNTYFLYSSDHGFQLGEFNILIDKRQP